MSDLVRRLAAAPISPLSTVGLERRSAQLLGFVRPSLVGLVRRALVTCTVAAVVAGSALAPAASAAGPAPEPPGLDAFMRGVGLVESGGRYDAVNPVSGAYGKYQIMPSNWPAWAKLYLGDSKAPQTPANQETLARARFIALYRWLGSWPRVACWWLTGSTKPAEEWSAATRRYVDKVMKLAGGMGWTPAVMAPAPSRTTTPSKASTATPPQPPAPAHLDEHDPAIAYAGSWSTAQHAGYAGGSVAWSSKSGASASVTFVGRSITWIGPVGSTRGAAQVYIDDVLVATVSEYASTYTPRKTLLSRDLSAGTHTLRIVVSATPGHPVVAIDELIVGF